MQQCCLFYAHALFLFDASPKEKENIYDAIKDLEEKLQMEKTVKQSEVDLNADYKKHIINLETRIIALGKLNNEFVDKITELKDIIARLTR